MNFSLTRSPVFFDLENAARLRLSDFGSIEESSGDSSLPQLVPVLANDDSDFGRMNKKMELH